MFRINDGKGFSIRFDNGYLISVQFGYGSYSSNRYETFGGGLQHVKSIGKWAAVERACGEKGSVNAEIAVMDDKNKFVGQQLGIFKDDDIEGWCSPERVLEVMNLVAGLQQDVVNHNEEVLENDSVCK